MNNMKSTFLFLLTTTMMTCTAYGQSSNHKENKLPDWAFGGFERPKNVNPVISPICLLYTSPQPDVSVNESKDAGGTSKYLQGKRFPAGMGQPGTSGLYGRQQLGFRSGRRLHQRKMCIRDRSRAVRKPQ